jgi:hypothetical protein
MLVTLADASSVRVYWGGGGLSYSPDRTADLGTLPAGVASMQ